MGLIPQYSSFSIAVFSITTLRINYTLYHATQHNYTMLSDIKQRHTTKTLYITSHIKMALCLKALSIITFNTSAISKIVLIVILCRK